ncbi:actin depolymerizing protein [Viridothelium virens]|uniref:Twinfilin n=1 Tax=Viridothelium virens TaxID=1048519 RepID=A0A6A6GTB4_VIRVR|nr:actin depolymerizing protein [Viridothelium virens]
MQSGISASQDLRDAFKTLQTTPSQRGLLAGITNESLVPVSTVPSTSPSFLDDLANLTSLLSPTSAAYILLRRDANPNSSSSSSSSFVAITFVPDAAPVRTKTLFASTRLTLLRDLGVEHFPETLFATTLEELTREGWLRHEAHLGLAAPLTEEERSLVGVKEEEEREGSGGTGVRRGHVSSGVSFPIKEEAVGALRGLGEGGGEGGLVQLKIDVASETIDLVSTSSATPHSLASAISSSEPRYSFYRYSETSSESGSDQPVVFIYTCPSESKIKERMLYASSRASIIAIAASEAGIEVSKKLEATNPDEITAQTLHDEFNPKSEQKSGFARPKRPGRR